MKQKEETRKGGGTRPMTSVLARPSSSKLLMCFGRFPTAFIGVKSGLLV
jgi:hypothetical protein